MTKTTKALITSAAIAGLLAGVGPAIQASTVLPSAKASFLQDQAKDKKDETAKEKHACAGKNSCKGKGGCATDGSVKNKAADAGIKEKHACAGKNSCKGNGGCATDGSVKHDDKKS